MAVGLTIDTGAGTAGGDDEDPYVSVGLVAGLIWCCCCIAIWLFADIPDCQVGMDGRSLSLTAVISPAVPYGLKGSTWPATGSAYEG